MELTEYLEEIELIRDQNDTEFEIYPMAVEIIQATLKNLSKRYVFARRKSPKGQIYYGISSFPDVAIIDKKFKNLSKAKIEKKEWNQLKGCLEVKALGAKLITEKEVEDVISNKPDNINQDIGQLIGQILWYKKVIYTNGIEWRYLYISEYTKELKDNIIEIVNKRIKKESNKESFDWWNEFKKLNFEIKDECITKDCTINWDDFIIEINKIKWE